MARTSIDRRKDFETFLGSIETTFNDFKENDRKAARFHTLNVVCHGSRVVQIFWGSRPFDSIIEGGSWKNISEFGATLLFSMTDNGYVVISLYPAYTENRKQLETCITLHIWLDPSKLLDKSFLKSCWEDFMSYMEYTSLEGTPTKFQKFKVWYLRNFKCLIIDNKLTQSNFYLFTKEVSKWVLSVGLSGIIVYFVTLSTQPSVSQTEIELKKVNRNLENVTKQLNKITDRNTNIKTVTVATDSIALKTKEILKNIEKYKAK